MFIEYSTYLDQKKNNTWTDTITLEVPLVQCATRAGYEDELTHLRYRNEQLQKIVNATKVAFAALNEIVHPIY